MSQTPRGPVLIDLDAEDRERERPDPASAPPVPEGEGVARNGAAMQRLAVLAGGGRRRPLARWFWGLFSAVAVFLLTAALWSFVANLVAANPVIGFIATVLIGAFSLVCLLLVLREVAAIARMARLDRVQAEAAKALADHDLAESRDLARHLIKFYGDREDLSWGRDRLTGRVEDVFDADAVLGLTERELMRPLDTAARREVEVAARQVALVTALVPLALADVLAALFANLRMIRRIAEIYGGRAGTFGTFRLLRAVLTHLVATGAVAVGDDVIHSVAGGSMLSHVSRRFGEGIINGALTARVGVASMEVCRPLPFTVEPRPSVTRLVQRALSGLFARNGKKAEG